MAAEQIGTARSEWQVGPTFLAGTFGAIVLAVLAVLTGRADLLVVALPLIVVVTWSYVARPSGSPAVTVRIGSRRPAEGESTRWTARLTNDEDAGQLTGVEQWHAVVDPTPDVQWDENRHSDCSIPEAGATQDDLDLTFALRRWGPAEIGAAQLVATSPWAAYVWGPVRLAGTDVRGLPRIDPFRGRAPIPHPVGLVGPNRSSGSGDGTEFADIRPFRPGDKLRAIHWPVTTRTGELHVRTSYAEHDAEVVLVLDASVDIGGRNDDDSSLDLGLRACAALSDHFLGRGDRVGLDVVGTSTLRHVPVSLGDRQLHRILDTLSRVVVGRFRDARPERVRLRISPGATVFLISPLLTELGATVAADLARRGLQVIVIDCLPTDLTQPDDDSWDRLALRLRMMERQAETDGLALHGVPISPWRGPGSLDAALQVLRRRPPARVRAR